LERQGGIVHSAGPTVKLGRAFLARVPSTGTRFRPDPRSRRQQQVLDSPSPRQRGSGSARDDAGFGLGGCKRRFSMRLRSRRISLGFGHACWHPGGTLVWRCCGKVLNKRSVRAMGRHLGGPFPGQMHRSFVGSRSQANDSASSG